MKYEGQAAAVRRRRQAGLLDRRDGAPSRQGSTSRFARRAAPTVREFYEAAMAAGGKDNGPPGVRASITRTTTARSCSIPTATTSRPSATSRTSGNRARAALRELDAGRFADLADRARRAGRRRAARRRTRRRARPARRAGARRWSARRTRATRAARARCRRRGSAATAARRRSSARARRRTRGSPCCRPGRRFARMSSSAPGSSGSARELDARADARAAHDVAQVAEQAEAGDVGGRGDAVRAADPRSAPRLSVVIDAIARGDRRRRSRRPS